MEEVTGRILVIDDEAIVRNSIVAYLEDSGFDVIEAEKELQSARENALNATVIYIISYYQFRRELGTLLESNTIE